MMSFASQPVVVGTKASIVRDRLAEAIISGEFKPGDRLVLDELARELGISKIPLREALSSLEGAGLVVTSPHAGPRVAPLPLNEIRGVYLVREAIESMAMELAADTLTEDGVEQLAKLNDQMRVEYDAGDLAALGELNAQFHLVIARATGYATIVESIEDLLIKVRRYRVLLEGMPAWPRAIEEHDIVIAALRAGDTDGAVAAMRAHVRHQGELEAPTGGTSSASA